MGGSQHIWEVTNRLKIQETQCYFFLQIIRKRQSEMEKFLCDASECFTKPLKRLGTTELQHVIQGSGKGNSIDSERVTEWTISFIHNYIICKSLYWGFDAASCGCLGSVREARLWFLAQRLLDSFSSEEGLVWLQKNEMWIKYSDHFMANNHWTKRKW